MRATLAVIVGYAVWTALWLGGNAIFMNDTAETVGNGTPFTDTGPLLGAIGLSVLCSLAAGATTASIALHARRSSVTVLAIALLATGIFVQASVWTLMPTWYHVVFLALLVPFVLLGAKLRPAPTTIAMRSEH